jgi:hypothetical protein
MDSFEYIFNNYISTSVKSKKKTYKKITSKTHRNTLTSIYKYTNQTDDIKLFNNKNNDFKNLHNFYKKYNFENITHIYEKLKNIIIDTENNDQQKWTYTSGLLLYNVYYFLIYKLSDIILPSDVGLKYFIHKIKKTIKFIQNDKNMPDYIQKNANILLNFEKNIQDTSIIIDKYQLHPITNNKYLSSFVVRIIDIFNRYFSFISSEFNNVNFGFYIPNDDKTSGYVKSIEESLKLVKIDMNNLIQTINQYRKEKIISNFEIKYQNDTEKNDYYLNKLNFIITYGYYFTYDTQKLFDYIDTKLIDGGNLILVANMETPIKSVLVKRLLSKFKKSIITKATLDDPFNWVFIGKGYIPNKLQYKLSKNQTIQNEYKINKFIDKTFIQHCKLFDKFLLDVENKSNISYSMLINEINKKYIEVYRWCLRNNIDAINIFADANKEPKLVDANKIVNYFFPDQKGVNKKDLQMFDISIYSITLPKEANIISTTIKKLLNFYNIDKNNITITDGTANVGGNTLSFSSYFTKVNSIEYDNKTYNGLVHNCKNIYKRHNITFYNGDCTKIIPTLTQDVIFIDPPWNGLFYKAYDKLHLYLGNKDIFDIVSDWYNTTQAKLYCIKCPFNFDFEPFIKNFQNIHIQKLKNWNVIYILS